MVLVFDKQNNYPQPKKKRRCHNPGPSGISSSVTKYWPTLPTGLE